MSRAIIASKKNKNRLCKANTRPGNIKDPIYLQDEVRFDKQQEVIEEVHRLCMVLQVSIVVKIVERNFELNADADTETL